MSLLARVTNDNRAVLAGGLLTGLFALAGMVGAVTLLHPGLEDLWFDQNLDLALAPPGTEGHLLGTDSLGRDLLWRTLSATGLSLLAAIGVTTIVLSLGLTLGSFAGYYGGRADRRISAIIDLAWGFPLVLVAVIVTGMIGRGITAIAVAIALVAWAGLARVVRAQVRSLRERDFVEALRALGVPELRILVRHVTPHLTGTVVVMASHYVGVTVITEAALSFLNLGVQPPTPSLGGMIANGRNYFSVSIWPLVVPGAVLALIVLGLNFLGDGLRDVLDPRLHTARGRAR